MLMDAFNWLKAHHPYWDRRGGRDHIWTVAHDEASCWVPAAIRPSIILSHWCARPRAAPPPAPHPLLLPPPPPHPPTLAAEGAQGPLAPHL